MNGRQGTLNYAQYGSNRAPRSNVYAFGSWRLPKQDFQSSQRSQPNHSDRAVRLRELSPSPDLPAVVKAAVEAQGQFVVVLCGLPGSGKSTFCRSLLQPQGEHQPGSAWRAFNQDALKSRQAVAAHTASALQSGYHVVVDRCNFDVLQRSHWIDLSLQQSAESARPAVLVAVVMPHFSNIDLCAARAEERGDSDGLHDADTNWKGVCARMADEFIFPSTREGFDCIVQCNDDEDIAQVVELLASV